MDKLNTKNNVFYKRLVDEISRNINQQEIGSKLRFKRYEESNDDDPIMLFDEKTKTSIKGMSENEIEIYAKILASNIIQTVLHVTYTNILKQMMEIHGSK